METRKRIFTWALVAVLIGGVWQARVNGKASAQQLDYVTQRALGDLTDQVMGLTRTLEKARYAATPVMQSALSAELLEQSGSAKTALSALSFSHEKTERISRFLSQVGDYALALTRKSFSGPLEAEDLDGLARLSDYAQKLSAALTDTQARVSVEGLPLLDDDFDSVAEEFSAMPSLLYDGPFSDHIAQQEPLGLSGTEVSQEKARALAAEFLHCDAASLDFSGEGGRQMPVYIFTREGEQVDITRQGGEIAYYKKENHGAGTMTYEEALSAAKAALKARGFESMQESYYVISDGLCMVNFHSTQDGILCYPDLVKVTVELERGGMVELDCTGYLMNHRRRVLMKPGLSEEEAAQSLSPLLTVESAKLAVIPTPGQSDVLCWEFLCREGEQRVLSYINGDTGLEEQLYLLQEDEHGVLTV